MNYRHIFHAGNFADVVKHAILARLVVYMQRKAKPFRVIDTHAGTGRYDLSSDAAQRTGEWRDGIGRLVGAEPPAAAVALLAPYLDAVRALNGAGPVTTYPGSPWLVRHLLRPQDRLSAIEMHPDDAAELASLFAGDVKVRITRLDGWLALGAHVPPKERRGIVLVDPPFEVPGEYDRLVGGLAAAHQRFPSGTYALWYPLKLGAPVAAFHARLADLSIGNILVAELSVRDAAAAGLTGCGLVIVNPPFTLANELDVLLPALRTILAQDPSATCRAFWLTAPT